ncbi:MAG: hypothetical protein EA427_13505, partial [Spirochaetaceae bacterium]
MKRMRSTAAVAGRRWWERPVTGAAAGAGVVVFVLASALALVSVFGGCRQSFDYYNPLDPAEDAPISEILPLIADPVIRNAIIDNGAQTKRELDWLWVNGNEHGGTVTTLEGIEFLSNLRNLTLHHAGLPGSPAVDMSPLVKIASLEYLNIERNQFDETNLDVIPFLPNLRSLRLADNLIRDAESLVALATPYGVGQLWLHANDNPILPETLPALQQVLNRFSGLNIAYGDGSLSDLSFLVPNDTIEFFDISGHDALTTLSSLSSLSRLQFLRADETGMDESLFLTIPVFPDGFRLSIRENDITDFSVVASYIGQYGRAGMQLEMGGGSLALEELWNLRPVMDRLEGLHLGSWFGGEGPLLDLDFLPQNDTIRFLQLYGYTVTDISAVSRLEELHSFGLEDNPAEFINGFEVLLNLPHLRELRLWNTPAVDWDVIDELMRRG